jgi:hypothetical protein
MRSYLIHLIATWLTLFSSNAIFAKDPVMQRELHPLEKKLVGTWIGSSPCVGKAIFEADGTYQLFGYGPGAGHREFGVWHIDWNEIPLKLVMKEQNSNLEESSKPESVKLSVLDGQNLAWQHDGGFVAEHLRGTNGDDDRIRLATLDSAVQTYLGNQNLGNSVHLPKQLQDLVDANLVPARSLKDRNGNLFQYDLTGQKNAGKKPDIWTQDKEGKTIGNWDKRE